MMPGYRKGYLESVRESVCARMCVSDYIFLIYNFTHTVINNMQFLITNINLKSSRNPPIDFTNYCTKCNFE